MADDNIVDEQVSDDTSRYPDVVNRFRPDKVNKAERDGQQFKFTSKNNIRLHISVQTPDIIKLNYTTRGDTQDSFSYAIDPEFNPQPTEIEFKQSKNCYEISTASLTCRVQKKEMLVQFFDTNGNLLNQDKRGYFKRESLMKGISEVTILQEAPRDMQFFGLGDKAVDLDLRGRSYENWNTDSYAYERGDDPLYRSIPFFMALHQGHAYGIFLDNPYRSIFDFDSKKNNAMSFSAEGGQMTYYFINGPQLQSVAQRYAKLTGTPEMPPLWGLGYHQCRWSYYPESRVKEVAKSFRKHKIPCDAIYLDIDYMKDYKVFTWNKEYFPNPKKMIADLKEEGFHTIVMIDPGVRVEEGYAVYEDGLEKNVFCKRPDGDLMIGPVWPPRTVFPDYTNPSVRSWWGDLYKDFMSDLDIGGIWNDMNEPAVFEVLAKTFPDSIRHNYDGNPCSHRKAHNIYGMQMARASHMGIKKHNQGNRPFLLTRANFAGGQRFAAIWTGDNIASWDHLQLANEQCLRLSISGYSFCGTDIGGFVEIPDAELYTRWLQLEVFHPLFRTHSMGYNVDGAAAVNQDEVEQRQAQKVRNREPWTFGKQITNISRKTIELRYQLLSYLYTAFRQYITEGTPILRPLVFYDQVDKKAITAEDEFFFGDHILVSPVLQEGKKSKQVYLPKGEWYHFWDDTRFKGQKRHKIDAPLKQIPFFVKAGTVLPLREVEQYVGEKDIEQMELFVYYGDTKEQSELYEDAGQGYAYEDGDYRLTTFTFESSGDSVAITTDREGDYHPSYNEFCVLFIGLPFEPESAEIDGEKAKIEQIKRHGQKAYSVTVNTEFEELTLT